MTVLAASIPDNSGYVVAAYLVFFTLLVVYLAITAFRLTRLERRIGEVSAQLDDADERRASGAADDEEVRSPDAAGVREHSA